MISQRVLADENSLDLDSFIDLARKNDVRIEQILRDRTKTGFLKDVALPPNPLILSVQNQYGFGLKGDENTDLWVFSGSKEFPETGTRIFANHEINEQEDRTENITSVGIEQSLFQNALGKQVRRQARSLDNENQAIYLQSVEAYEDYIAIIINEFLEWRLSYLNYLATKDLYDQANRFQILLQARQKRRVALKVDVDKVTLESLNYQEGLLTLETTLVDQRANIIKKAGIENRNSLNPANIPDLFTLEIDYEKQKQEALEKSRTKQALEQLKEAGRLEILVRREDLYPEINFVAGFNYDKSNRFGTSTDRQEVFLGFNFNWPFFDRQDRGQLRQAKFEHISAVLAEKEYLKNLQSALVSQAERIRVGRELLKVSQEKWKISERVVRAEKKRYENGRIDVELLILAHQDLAENYFTYLENQIRLNKEIIEWLRLTDRLVVKDRVQLN
jgi:outer membrane protein TolC